jgi:hypothetical protein
VFFKKYFDVKAADIEGLLLRAIDSTAVTEPWVKLWNIMNTINGGINTDQLGRLRSACSGNKLVEEFLSRIGKQQE